MSRFSFFIPGAGFTGLPGFNLKPEKALVPIPEATLTNNGSSLLDIPFQGELRLGKFVFPIEPIVQVSSKKRIVKTDLSGFNGSIKEDMGMDDYSVTIMAVLLNEDDDSYPDFLVNSLRLELEKAGSIPVYNKILSVLNITHLAVEDVEYDTPEGYGSQVLIKIMALSDYQPELILLKMLQS